MLNSGHQTLDMVQLILHALKMAFYSFPFSDLSVEL